MTRIVLSTGKVVDYEDRIASINGVEITVHQKLSVEERQEFKKLLMGERDVVGFVYLNK